MTAPPTKLLDTACKTLSDADPALARAYTQHGRPTWRAADPCYAMLGRMIAHQQISTKAAETIWGRVLERFGEDLSPDVVLSASEAALRDCGLSRPKVAHLKSIAEALASGALRLDRICNAPLDEARAELLAVRGIGPWTAELFLLYAVGAPDAFPVGDVGLMESHRMLGDYTPRMDVKTFTRHAEAWRPYRGVAAHLLWGWLNDRRAESARNLAQA